jgi:hypothetical protein
MSHYYFLQCKRRIDKKEMGDVQRIERLNTKLRLLDMCIDQTKRERRILNEQMANSFGDVFLDLFQDIANLDQLITDLRKEKQRIQNLI